MFALDGQTPYGLVTDKALRAEKATPIEKKPPGVQYVPKVNSPPKPPRRRQQQEQPEPGLQHQIQASMDTRRTEMQARDAEGAGWAQLEGANLAGWKLAMNGLAVK